jgi:thiol-disulfide isomerase/thioredoxin
MRVVNIFFMVTILLLLPGCIEQTVTEESSVIMSDNMDQNLEMENLDETELEVEEELERLNEKSFLDYELTDALSGQVFKLSDFAGTFVLLESFAVWCPTCTRQQEILKDFHQKNENVLVTVSLDTDPNEDVEIVRKHAENNGFDWKYAISPVELTAMLIDEFGYAIVSAPNVPMVLICEDQSFRMLDSGKKSVEELKEEIEAGC